jgi:hypothetical protein
MIWPGEAERGAIVSSMDFSAGMHLVIGAGCPAPHVELLSGIASKLHWLVYKNPELKPFVPDLLGTDLCVQWYNDNFILWISPEMRAWVPTRGMTMEPMAALQSALSDHEVTDWGFSEISEMAEAVAFFLKSGFTPGFASMGHYPISVYTAEAAAKREQAVVTTVDLIEGWARRRRHIVENSKIFLSHKGINKAFVEKVDRALRMLGLKTWFDQDDLMAGDPLLRSVDGAFADCSAAVFFISGDYADAGVIAKEIDRALHENAVRSEGFKIVPLVLAQHGGTDQNVPAPLQTLVWKTVQDIDVVPSILRSLPKEVQGSVRYIDPK